MPWTKEKLAQIPEPYRDFMLGLRPVIESRRPEKVLKITGVPVGMLHEAFSSKYGYGMDQIRKVAENLRREGYVNEDEMGFFTPTSKGEQMIVALAALADACEELVPPLPSL